MAESPPALQTCQYQGNIGGELLGPLRGGGNASSQIGPNIVLVNLPLVYSFSPSRGFVELRMCMINAELHIIVVGSHITISSFESEI